MAYAIESDDPDQFLFRSRPDRGREWTTNHLIRHYASTISIVKHYDGYDIDPSLDNDPMIPKPTEKKVVLQAGWINECVKEGEVLVGNDYNGWTVR